MDYFKHYFLLMDRSVNRTEPLVVEQHHVIPKCMGGSDEDTNIVKLTPEEHYVAHQLLIRMYPNNDKLVYAANMMVVNRSTNKMYGWLKRRFIDVAKKRIGKNNSQFGTMWITNGSDNKKIPVDGMIPSGWSAGRVIKSMMKKTRICPHCGSEYIGRKKYCSIKCGQQHTLSERSEKIRKSRIGKKRSNDVREKISMGMKKYHSAKTL